MERWKGRVALVTGASSGIGRATATRLEDAGMVVIAAARRAERLDALADERPGIVPMPVDLRDTDAIVALFERIRAAHGGVDVLVNNAGLGRHSPLMSGDTEAWREMLEVNVLALSVCTREALADMRRRGDDGHVLHISSMAGHRTPGGSGLYSATKFAVRALTEGLRQELRAAGSRVRVTAISPGFVETEFAQVYTGDAEAARATYSRFPVLQAADIADMVVYALASPPHMQIHDMLVRPTEQPS
ncbi:MAG: SDR family NAD(P)-dependent oxidoreductase [Myxococcota bacterium]|jgi:NADP-dependent 3-hydroxy acid dehydrogenase YdfG|nr:SDR family NAD(P)-dependent oxidoreductase [Myxococcota bacterium]